MSYNQYKRILVIQTAFIGDAILASSVAEKLHHHFPEAEISMLVRNGNEHLYANHPFLKQTLVWNKKEHKLRNLFSLLGFIRKQKFDLVVNCHRHASSGILSGFSGASHITGYKQNPFSFLFNVTVKHVIGNGSHEVDRYNQLIEDMTGREVFKPRLYPSTADMDHVQSYKTEKYVCMAPSSVWFTKQLPQEKWIELCNQLGNTRIYLLGAPSDQKLCETILNSSSNKNIRSLAGKLSLLQSCALMKDAAMNYVNDSAPLHLASSVNAPVTAFFCSTVPAFGFTPLSDDSRIVETHEPLDCRPCGLHGFKQCPKGHFKCGHTISLTDVGQI
ncbi:MAG: glycosyltransferase family 9 protein [Bacteroidetes bacterium]|nr:glycosyltransferase family 9 protein [Bacteroidota bacterium]